MEIEIGLGKAGRRGYGLDDISVIPSRRTRDADDVDITWEMADYHFELPLLASAMDAVVDVEMAIRIGRLGGLAVLNLEGLQTRYENPVPIYEEIASFSKEEATEGLQRLYREPVKEELIARRIGEIKEGGVIAAASLTPQRVENYYRIALEAGLDIMVIQGTVISAEHVSSRTEPVNLKKFTPDIPR